MLSEIGASILEAESTTMLTVTTAQSTEPLTVQLRFATPYGYQAATLLAEFDGLVCRILTARYVGTLNVFVMEIAEEWQTAEKRYLTFAD